MSAASDRLRWIKWWPQDWQRDPALRTCGPAARGVWIDLLCIAHEGEPYGHVTINGRCPTNAQIARIVGVTEKEAARLIGELEDAGVFSRSESGAIYCRRMVRDKAARDQGREHGKGGGNPILTKRVKGGDAPGIMGGLTPPVIAQEAEARSKKESSEADASDAPAAAAASPPPTQSAASLFPEPAAPPSSPQAAPTIRDALWRDGVPILRALCGQSDRQARSALGRMLRDARDDCARLYAALREAENLRPADPMAWLARAASAASRDPPHKPGRLDWAREEVARLTGPPRAADSATFVDTEQWENVS